MTGEFSPSLSWLTEFRPLFGRKVDLILEPRSQDPDAPKIDYGTDLPEARRILLQESDQADEQWITALAAELLSLEWQACLINLVTVPIRSVRSTVGTRLLR